MPLSELPPLPTRIRSHAALGGLALLALAAAIYWPGLAGGFLFDDFANLPALSRYGGVHDWQTLTWYAWSGIADPTGRPVSMLSFLVDARDWPADPWPFKRTNLVLHLANGVLLFGALRALGRWIGAAHAQRAALLAAALWLLHPLWVSTVLYVIQRQAMLAAFFVLAGTWTWIASREAFARSQVHRAWLLALLAVPVFGTLAGLSKANGFLLPVLVCVLESTVLARRARDAVSAERAARWSLAYLPALLVLGAMLWTGLRGAPDLDITRGWSLGQRLLSEPRALGEYLLCLLLPGLQGRGVFADTFVASTGLLQPWTTLPALIAVVAVSTVAALGRHRWPAASAAALFFLAGHAMESSVIALELYFEHRNYLPAALLFWPFALAITRGSGGGVRAGGAVTLVVLFAVACAVQVQPWRDPATLAQHWARTQPHSPRAQAYAASVDLGAGRVDAAIARLAPLAASVPDEPQYALNLLDARCLAGPVPQADVEGAVMAIGARGVGNDAVYRWLVAVLSPAHDAACSLLPEATSDSLLQAALSRPPANVESEARRADLRAIAALRARRCDAAYAAMQQRVHLQRRPEFVHTQVGLLATYCDPRLALRHLDDYLQDPQPLTPAATPALRLRDWLMARDRYWPQEWHRLRAVLLEDIASHAATR